MRPDHLESSAETPAGGGHATWKDRTVVEIAGAQDCWIKFIVERFFRPAVERIPKRKSTPME